MESMEPEFNRITFAATGGRENMWAKNGKIVIPGGAEWLLDQDPFVAEFLVAEREIYRHHLGVHPSHVPTSLSSKTYDRTPDIMPLQ